MAKRTTAPPLLTSSPSRDTTGLIADKTYDNNALRQLIAAAGSAAVIPSLSLRKTIIPHECNPKLLFIAHWSM